MVDMRENAGAPRAHVLAVEPLLESVAHGLRVCATLLIRALHAAILI
jgi:hypothetical protein